MAEMEARYTHLHAECHQQQDLCRQTTRRADDLQRELKLQAENNYGLQQLVDELETKTSFTNELGLSKRALEEAGFDAEQKLEDKVLADERAS